MLSKRDRTIDILRGLAIFAMIGANMIPVLLRGTPPFFLRLYGSFAAPMFIFLSGMMVSFASDKGNRRAAYFSKRTVMLLILGALLDAFVVGIYPFMTFDVLYLIGISMFLTYLFGKIKPGMKYVIIILIFAAAPLLQKVFGYYKVPLEMYLWESGRNASISPGRILRQWLIDGWFPIFPWLGFAFLGSIGWDIRRKYKSFSNLPVIFTGLIILITGEILWNIYPGQLYIRNGYSELFYPPTPGFIITSIGIIIILFYIIDLKNDLSIYTPFSILGRHSLQIYVIHLVLIGILGKIFGPQNMSVFLMLYAGIFLLFVLMDKL